MSTRRFGIPAILLLMLLSLAGPAFAQEPEGGKEGPQERIEGLRSSIVSLEKSLPAPSAEETRVLRSEIEAKRDEVRRIVAGSIDDALKDEGLAAFLRATLVEDQGALIQSIESRHQTITGLRSELEDAVGEERLRIENLLTRENRVLDRLIRAFAEGVGRQDRLGEDVSVQAARLAEMLELRAETIAGLIREAIAERERVLENLANLPAGQDNARLQAELEGWQEKLRGTTDSLEATTEIMAIRGIDTAEYRTLLISATGKITGDILDTRVAMGLTQRWLRKARSWIVEGAPGFLFNALLFLAILFVFRILASIARRLVRRGLERAEMGSTLLRQFLIGLTSKTIFIVGVLVALSQVGVNLGPMLAGFGIAGFIVGFALQDTLSNFASGLMILAYRPFDVGDVIEGGGVKGIVDNMSLVSTTIRTFDNEKLIVPNNKIWGDVIRNVTAQTTRRVDLVFGIAYEDDVDKAETVLQEIIEAHPAVLADPAPVIKLNALSDSSVDFVVRPWVKTEDYWNVYWDVTRSVKKRFDAEGISIPYPQRTVHVQKGEFVEGAEA